MAQDQPRRSKADRIERLRTRLDDASRSAPNHPLVPILKGILDLLADEL